MRVINLDEKAIRAGWVVCKLPVQVKPSIDGLAACFFVKGTFRLRNGAPATHWEEMPEVGSGDVAFDDNPALGIGYADDFVPFKPKGEFLAKAEYFPPDADRRPHETLIRVGGLTKRLVVYGERDWAASILGETPGKPIELCKVPISYANAWGGPDSETNPLGKGQEGLEMHLIENFNEPIATRSASCLPGGYAPIPTEWAYRREKLGTYDNDWLHSRWPWVPVDFDPGYYNAAPPSQWIEGYWRGDEEIELENLHPQAHIYRSRLPGLRARCFVERKIAAGTDFLEVPLDLDTVWMDTVQEKLILVWRGRTPTASIKLRDFESLMVLTEPLASPPKPPELCRELLRKAIEERKPQIPVLPAIPSAAEIEAEVHASIEKARADARQEGLAIMKEASDYDHWIAKALETMPDPYPKAVAAAREAAAKGVEPKMPSADEMHAAWQETLRQAGDFALKANNPAAATEIAALQAKAAAVPVGLDQWEAQTKHKMDGIDAQVAAAFPKKEDRATVPPGKVREHLASSSNLRGARLDGFNFSGMDLSGVCLAEASLEGANFTGAILRGADLSGAQLMKANLTDADLSGARLDDALLLEAVVAGSTWRGAFVGGAYLRKLDFTGIDFTGIKGRMPDFSESLLEGAHFEHAELDRPLFMNVRADGANFSRSRMQRPFFYQASVRNAWFEDCEIELFYGMDGCDFTQTSFRRSKCDGGIWKFSRLDGANFRQCSLLRADFSEASVRSVFFDRCILVEATFDDSSLPETFLTNANLFRACFDRADLTGARLDGSNLFQASFWETVLRSATWENANTKRTRLAELGSSK